ncbi:MAG: transcriptional regulator [Candidatus Obscuribacterales bacterium]|nr:transcriptional regulator [Candidatus Obscuribacterales bacterium]
MSNRLERLCNIEKLINKGQRPSPQYLADLLEVSVRTIYSDIQYLRDRSQMKIRFDQGCNGYVNDEPKAVLPRFDITDSELIALAISKGLVIQHSIGSLEAPMEAAIDKIVERRNGASKELTASVSRAVEFKLASNSPFQRRLLEDVLKAIEQRRVVRIGYYAAYANESSDRKVEPIVIQESGGSWYLWAWCRLRKDYRNFALHRVKDWELLPQTFEERADARKKIADRTFQVEVRHPEVTVKVRFDEVASRYVKEKQWHAKQQITERTDGSVDLEFLSQSLEETKRWVLSYGASATVLEPRSLRDLVQAELLRSTQNYAEVDKPAE